VEEAVRSLGYEPNLAARALRTHASSSIGVILPTMADPFWGSVGEEIVEAASAAGVSTMVASTRADADRIAEAIHGFSQRRVDAILAVGLSVVTTEFAEVAQRIPCVLLNRDLAVPRSELIAAVHAPLGALDESDVREEGAPYSIVRTDDAAGSGALVDHLVGLGHRRLAFCGGEPAESSVRRIVGFRQALEAAGADCLAVDLEGDSPRAAFEAASRLLGQTTDPVAIVGVSDLSAMGVLRAAHEAGRAVPGEVSVAGIDGLQIARYLEPPLTTLRQRTTEIARVALDMIERRAGVDAPPERVLVPGDLVARDSTGTPSSR
jgi:LacI family transcriptional regulator